MLLIPKRFLSEKSKGFRKIVLEIKEMYQCSLNPVLEKILFFYRLDKSQYNSLSKKNKKFFDDYYKRIQDFFDYRYFEYLSDLG